LVSAQYMFFQIVALLLSSMIVPRAATLMDLNLLVVQLLWSFVLSLIGLLILVKFSS
jgi:hypothetical protein